MRISDWSSDVCSSDLPPGALDQAGDGVDRRIEIVVQAVERLANRLPHHPARGEIRYLLGQRRDSTLHRRRGDKVLEIGAVARFAVVREERPERDGGRRLPYRGEAPQDRKRRV